MLKIKRKLYFLIIPMSILIISCNLFLTESKVHNLFDDDDESPFEDFGKDLGNLAIYFLVLGFFYVILKRIFIFNRNYYKPWLLNQIDIVSSGSQGAISTNLNFYEKQLDFISYYKTLYPKIRPYAFLLHNFINLGATFVAIIHGFTVEDKSGFMFYTGWIAALTMLLLSLSGFIMWKINWFGHRKESRKWIRFVHRQWLLTIIVIVFLLLHLAIGDD